MTVKGVCGENLVNSSEKKRHDAVHGSGLYDPENEHDNCGFGFIANIKNQKSHHIITQALEILENLDHRGAVGADPLAGDGAGILIQVPDSILREEMEKQKVILPSYGRYGVAMVFLPRNEGAKARCIESIEKTVHKESLNFLGWRVVPTDNSCLGESVKPNEPIIVLI